MNREDIIRMAIEAELNLYVNDLTEKQYIEVIERFAALVASAEREACIKACEEVTADLKNYASAFEGITAETKFIRNIGGIVGVPFIESIKARGQA